MLDDVAPAQSRTLFPELLRVFASGWGLGTLGGRQAFGGKLLSGLPLFLKITCQFLHRSC